MIVLLFALEHINEFTWFGHMWSHQQPHLYQNISSLESDMMLNKQFAIVSRWRKSASHHLYQFNIFQ